MSPDRQRCHGCGTEVSGLVFACPSARPGDNIDHLLLRKGPPAGVAWPEPGDPLPFRRFRRLLWASSFASACGLDDAWLSTRIGELDEAITRVDGTGFRHTPLLSSAELAAELGVVELWVKNETGNVAGSHKARHLFGIALALEVAIEAGLGKRATPLAIASCGNAALAAAVVARALDRRMQVFIPTWAEGETIDRIAELGANIKRCARLETDPPGDPCIHRFREAVSAGAIPFGCQGPDNGLAIDGGMTLAFELADQLSRQGGSINRLYIQVGGGALASSLIQGLRWAASLGVLERLPQIHAVQTEACSPLATAWKSLPNAPDFGVVARRRSFYMRPVAEPQTSLASGILDDETYDWLEICRGLHDSGGSVVVASEERITDARELAQRATGLSVSATGSAGLAGALLASHELGHRGRVGVILTGR